MDTITAAGYGGGGGVHEGPDRNCARLAGTFLQPTHEELRVMMGLAAPAIRTHWLRNWRPVCGAPATEPSARVLDQERTCLRCLEVVDGAFDAVEVSRG